MQILPPQPPSNRLSPIPPAGTCGPDGKRFCPATWPTNILGPIPRAPSNATLIITDANPPAASHNFTTCGQYCPAASDCGPGDSTDECFCAIPSRQDGKTLGLDPIAPVSVCLVLALAITGISVGMIPCRDTWMNEVGRTNVLVIPRISRPSVVGKRMGWCGLEESSYIPLLHSDRSARIVCRFDLALMPSQSEI